MARGLAFGCLLAALSIVAGGLLLHPATSVPPPPSITAPLPGKGDPSSIAGAYETRSQAVSGYLVQASIGKVTVDSGPLGVFVLGTDDRTTVERGSGHAFRIDQDLSRLQPGDYVWVAASTARDGQLVAHVITANGFVSRDGYVSDIGPDYLDIRLRLDRYSKDFSEATTRFWLDPSASVSQQPSLSPVFASDITIGQHVALQGYIADDGAFVVLYLDQEAY